MKLEQIKEVGYEFWKDSTLEIELNIIKKSIESYKKLGYDLEVKKLELKKQYIKEILEKRSKLNKYYFTFGWDEKFPYIGGWVLVYANSRDEATQKFSNKFPKRENGLHNFSFLYNEEDFKETEMYKNNNNLGADCHLIIQ